MPLRLAICSALFASPVAAVFAATGVDEPALAARFGATVHPFVTAYCLPCHDADKPEAELDLSGFTSLEKVTAAQAHWELILERLEAGDMPSDKAKKFPTPDERAAVIEWIKTWRTHEAGKNAGDPGPVFARRLSNAEYDYTIRDLIGVDLRPTKEFPIDPANQAGFDNSGESLTMSPALFKKYYDAARAVADNVVFQPTGFVFAPHPMLVETDRDKYSVLRIVDFYQRQPTDYAEYFLAAWRYHHRAALGQPEASLNEVADASKVSRQYLPLVWAVLTDPAEQVGPIAKLQGLWRALPPPSEADPAVLRERTRRMREWVLNLRDQIVPDVPNLSGGGFGAGSQAMVLWKDRQMAANRRRFDPAKLRPGTPSPVEETIAAVLDDAAGQPASDASETAAMKPVMPASAAAQRGSVARVNEAPKPGARLPTFLSAASGPMVTTAADGRKLSAVEIADLAVGRKPARKAGDPLPSTPDIVKFGGVFLEPPVVTTSSSVTAMQARAKKRGGKLDPDLVVPEEPAERARHEASFARFASVFPDAFFISERARVYYDAEAEESLEGRLLSAGTHNQTGYFRDDTPLRDLILDETAQRELDGLWDIFNYNAEVPARMHLAFLSSEGRALRGTEFDGFRPENREATSQPMIKKLADLTFAALEKNPPSEAVVGALREHFEIAAANNRWLEQTREAAIPTHLDALQQFAERAYRRPLTNGEREDLRAFYQRSRNENGLNHEDAIRDAIVRVLMSPHFSYRIDLNDAIAGATTRADEAVDLQLPAGARLLTDYQLASRLSYFLWASMPDARLLARAAAGELRRAEVLRAEARRMLKDERARNFATEFGGHWLDFRRFEDHNAVDRERYPAFDKELRAAMFEEPIRFLVDLVREDRSVLECLYGDYTFVNAALAKHYGVPGAIPSGEWMRVTRAAEFERGGLLPMAVFLTANSPGLRTSPVKRGYWVVRRILGERIPPPPPDVPVLPADEKNLGELTVRETLAKHRDNAACAGCHARFDSFGLAFENFSPIGEWRLADAGGRAVDSRAEFPGGIPGTGLGGLREYIRGHREADFIDNLARKLLAFALGRTLLLSDEALVAEMKTKLATEENRFGALVEAIVVSPQFRTKRAAPIPSPTASLH